MNEKDLKNKIREIVRFCGMNKKISGGWSDWVIKDQVDELYNLMKDNNKITGDTSDGYHTFNELYEHRIALFITICNLFYLLHSYPHTDEEDYTVPWKSKKHSDGSEIEGWFIAGIGKDAGYQITYHLPLKVWDKLRVVACDQAPEWDGHTPDDVIKRLYALTLSENEN